MVPSTSTIGYHFKYKDPQTILHSTGAVYQLSCSCGKSYIGQIIRKLKFRVIERKPSSTKSNLDQHLNEFPSYFIDFISSKIQVQANN